MTLGDERVKLKTKVKKKKKEAMKKKSTPEY
jgi:hypothetical protein